MCSNSTIKATEHRLTMYLLLSLLFIVNLEHVNAKQVCLAVIGNHVWPKHAIWLIIHDFSDSLVVFKKSET